MLLERSSFWREWSVAFVSSRQNMRWFRLLSALACLGCLAVEHSPSELRFWPLKQCHIVQLTAFLVSGCKVVSHGLFIWMFKIGIGGSINVLELICQADEFLIMQPRHGEELDSRVDRRVLPPFVFDTARIAPSWSPRDRRSNAKSK